MTVEFTDQPDPGVGLSQLPRSDSRVYKHALKVALLFEEMYRGQYIHAGDTLGWHRWVGTHWEPCDARPLKRELKELIRKKWMDALEDPSLKSALEAAQKGGGVMSVLGWVAALESIAVEPADLDADPYLLNTPSGTLDLRTMEVRKHNPSDRITNVTMGAHDDHDPRPDHSDIPLWAKQAPTFAKFIETALPDLATRQFVQRYCGQALLGRVLENKLLIAQGPAGTGKSTFGKTIQHMLGTYAIEAEPDLLLARQGAHTTGQTDLRGKRFVTTSETEENVRMNSATMKRLTGGDNLRARRMHKDNVQWKPSHTLYMGTNHFPEVSGNDSGVWRRVRVVKFLHVIPEEQQDKRFDDQLQLEANGVLRWALDGWIDYQANGEQLGLPESVKEATDKYREDSDAFGQFLDAFYVQEPYDPNTKTPKETQKSVRQAYAAHMGVTEKEVKSHAFADLMEARGFVRVPGTGNVACFGGLRRKTEQEAWETRAEGN